MADGLAIRAMDERDIPAVCELARQLTGRPTTPEQMRERLEWVRRSPVDWLYVCEVDGQVRGWFGFRLRESLTHPDRYGEVSVIVADAAVRRRGVGRAMMEYAEQLARDHGCIGTWLVSGLHRADEAHRFYADLGYQVTGYRFVKRFEG